MLQLSCLNRFLSVEVVAVYQIQEQPNILAACQLLMSCGA